MADTNLVPDVNKAITRLTSLAPAMRRSIDAGNALPGTPQQLFTDVNYLWARGFGPVAQGALIKTNLVPALLTRGDYGWTTWTKAGSLSLGGAPAGEETAKWVRSRTTLLLDSEQGAATVRALVESLAGNVAGGSGQLKPSWLVAATEALANGEAWVLSRNSSLIAGATEAINTWAKETKWFGWTPSSDDRKRVAAASAQMVARAQAGGALDAQAYLNAMNAASGVPSLAPPGTMPMWQKVLVTGAVAALGLGAVSYLRRR